MEQQKVKWYINVNKHTIRDNAVNGLDNPPVRVSRGKSGEGHYCHEVELPAGSRILYSAAKPLLKCGAKLVIECPTRPTILK